jgi:AbrB family looped-hinge helix DNA binding protein
MASDGIDEPQTATFVAKLNKSGDSLRITIPAIIREALNLKNNDYIDITVQKRKQHKKNDGLSGGYE